MFRIDVFTGTIATGPYGGAVWNRGPDSRLLGYVSPLGERTPTPGQALCESWWYTNEVGDAGEVGSPNVMGPWEMAYTGTAAAPDAHPARPAEIRRHTSVALAMAYLRQQDPAVPEFHWGTWDFWTNLGAELVGYGRVGRLAGESRGGSGEVWVMPSGVMPAITTGTSHVVERTQTMADDACVKSKLQELVPEQNPSSVGIFTVVHAGLPSAARPRR